MRVEPQTSPADFGGHLWKGDHSAVFFVRSEPDGLGWEHRDQELASFGEHDKTFLRFSFNGALGELGEGSN